MSDVVAWLLVYAIVAVVVFGAFALDAADAPTRNRQRLARCALAAPVWPLLLVWAIGCALRWLWRAADLGRSS